VFRYPIRDLICWTVKLYRVSEKSLYTYRK